MDPNFLGNFLHVDIVGADEVAQKLQRLFPEVTDPATEAANDVLIELLSAGYDTPYTYVSWAEIGGFITERQRRFVMAMMSQGLMTAGIDARTFEMLNSWEKVGLGANQYVVNTSAHAPWVMGQGEQARMHIAQGWLDDYEWASRHSDEVVKAYQDALDAALAEWNEEMMSVAP